jgi:arylsulfatase A-like enzyme
MFINEWSNKRGNHFMEKSNKTQKYNVVLITVDSLRADFLGTYNPEIRRENTTPNIDAWARKACTFSRTITQSSHTSPAFLGILSGNYPSKYGDWFNVVSDKRPLMAEILKDHGYHTYAFNSNPYISHYYNFNRGFDLYQDNMPPLTGKKVKKTSLFLLSRLKAVLSEPYENAETINSQVMKQLPSIKAPYFIWVHYMDVHGPYIPKKGWSIKNRIKAAYLWRKSLHRPAEISPDQRNWLIKSYKEEIAYLDHHIMTLLNHFNQEDTIVILTADHGDLFGEHDLYGHTLKLYNQLLHVPLFIKHQDTQSGHCVKSPVRSIDILPTLMEILNIKTDHAFDGRSILTLMNNEAGKSEDGPIISEVSRKHLCVEKNDWKLIVNYKNNVKELYNLSEDPYEKINVYDQNPNIAKDLEEIIQEHLKSNKGQDMSAKIEHNEEMKIRLKALGYMD